MLFIRMGIFCSELQECLEVLHLHNLILLDAKTKGGQRAIDVASPTCRELINTIGV